ncbi:hypothetical protein BG261_02490 [Floricoccus tropicus]|uniref:DUF3272 domain-containing protein n=1 Tax=Floricoccus tropicus TaxID=1859473 RepID=A0A1E8GMJ2_9LACT|nr:DUF3272 family protein [Floricoccus tropicus]OFI49465.1 hypothetical protein BG261_02490 [Floricoccus tropicus]
MFRSQFIPYLLITMIEAWCFADSLFRGYLFFTALWGFFLFDRLRKSYLLDKAVKKAGLV